MSYPKIGHEKPGSRQVRGQHGQFLGDKKSLLAA